MNREGRHGKESVCVCVENEVNYGNGGDREE